jgi:hypothetical protein
MTHFKQVSKFSMSGKTYWYEKPNLNLHNNMIKNIKKITLRDLTVKFMM